MGQLSMYRPKLRGPAGSEILTCSFTTSGSTSDVTTNEAQGCSVARTGVGTFEITTDGTYKRLTLGMSVQAATTAQLFIVTSPYNPTTRKMVIKQVTAGGGTAVDTLAATIDLVMVGRTQS